MRTLSPLQIERLKYQPKLPSSLAKGINSLELSEGAATQSVLNCQKGLLLNQLEIRNKLKLYSKTLTANLL